MAATQLTRSLLRTCDKAFIFKELERVSEE